MNEIIEPVNAVQSQHSSHVSVTEDRRKLSFAVAAVLLVAAISVALTMQGWKSRVIAFDLLTYVYGVRDFLETGRLLQHGDTGSYGSYKPPGTAWLMLPSTLLFSDPRLSEYVGTALLHLATLLGLFFLARRYFGLWTGVLAAFLYGLSAHGLFLAGSLWPNGRPDFYIWIVFFTSLWVLRKDGKYLAAALGVWGLGMLVDMGITPVFFVLPVVWLYYRPPIRIAPLLVVAAVVLIAWSPYLMFEAPRRFVDIRSQLLQKHIFTKNYQKAWCDPDRMMLSLEGGEEQDQAVLVQAGDNPAGTGALFQPVAVALEKTLYNFDPVAPVPGAPLVLLLLTLASLVVLNVPGAPTIPGERVRRPRFQINRVTLAGLGMILLGLLLSGFALRLFLGASHPLVVAPSPNLYKLQKVLLSTGFTLAVIPWFLSLVSYSLARLGVHIQTEEQAEKTRLLVICLIVPWFILLLLAEPGKPERFMWLFPMQTLFLAALVTDVLPRLRMPRVLVWAVGVALVLIIGWNYFLLSRVEAWSQTGWAGPDAEEIRVADAVARQVRAEGKDQASIGYRTFIYPFMAQYHITNPIYKVGAEFDMLFYYRHGIHNTNQCAEGLAPGDEYLIVQTRPKAPEWAPKHYFDFTPGSEFHLVEEIDSFQVYKKD
jgi:4-amino-4-deoxy-L-arabinose transferase-like glycosyltransferase